MTIYQVLNEENQFIQEYQDLEFAQQEAELLTLWNDEHYYHVQLVEFEEV